MQTKFCKKGNHEVEISLMVKNKNRPDGYDNVCKECLRNGVKHDPRQKRIKEANLILLLSNRRICYTCEKEKSIEDFNIDLRKKIETHGLDLQRAICKKCERNKHLQNNYEITQEEFDLFSLKQNNKCAICEKEKKLFVDHDHETGKIRGLLCHKCNLLLGQCKDDIKILEKAKQYLNGN